MAMASTGHFVLTNDIHENLPTFFYCVKNIAYLRVILGAALYLQYPIAS